MATHSFDIDGSKGEATDMDPASLRSLVADNAIIHMMMYGQTDVYMNSRNLYQDKLMAIKFYHNT